MVKIYCALAVMAALSVGIIGYNPGFAQGVPNPARDGRELIETLDDLSLTLPANLTEQQRRELQEGLDSLKEVKQELREQEASIDADPELTDPYETKMRQTFHEHTQSVMRFVRTGDESRMIKENFDNSQQFLNHAQEKNTADERENEAEYHRNIKEAEDSYQESLRSAEQEKIECMAQRGDNCGTYYRQAVQNAREIYEQSVNNAKDSYEANDRYIQDNKAQLRQAEDVLRRNEQGWKSEIDRRQHEQGKEIDRRNGQQGNEIDRRQATQGQSWR